MGLPKPLGPHNVSFADFELKREDPEAQLHDKTIPTYVEPPAVIEAANGLNGNVTELPPAPMMRIYYPIGKHPSWWSWRQISGRRWLPSVNYSRGYMSMLLPPVTWGKKILCWMLSGLAYILLWPADTVHASVAQPLLKKEEDGVEGLGGNGKFPVIVMSHGAWSMRATYSGFCCDLASYGYVVVAPEHLDGSASMAQFTGADQRRRWLLHDPIDVKFPDVPTEHRSMQLKQRVGEIRAVANVLGGIEKGLYPDSANVVKGGTRLSAKSLKGCLDLHNLAIAGHSFGGATAVVVPGVDSRFTCSLALDCWWQPVEQEGYDKAASGVPQLFVNTGAFNSGALKQARNKYFEARTSFSARGTAAVTELRMIKGTEHNDQSDIVILLPRLWKRLGLAGELDPKIAKDINSKLCLDFLFRNFTKPGGKNISLDISFSPIESEHIVVGTETGDF